MAAFNPIPDETTNAALKPTAKALGDASGSLFTAGFHLIFDPLRKFNIRKDQELTDYANKIQNHITDIPEEYRDASKLSLVLKAVDDSKYRLDDATMREAFARLIANALDKRQNEDFYPAYSDILSNMSSNEALLLQHIRQNFGSSILTLKKKFMYENLSYTIEKKTIFIFDFGYDPSPKINLTIDLLHKSELITIDSDFHLTDEHYAKQYSETENELMNKLNTTQIPEGTKLSFQEGSIRLSAFGESFTKFIV